MQESKQEAIKCVSLVKMHRLRNVSVAFLLVGFFVFFFIKFSLIIGGSILVLLVF